MSPKGFLLVVLWALASWPALAFTGTVSAVHDGDTFTLAGGQRIRVFGIDAPELHQQCRSFANVCKPCGEAARQALAELIQGKKVECRDRGKSYDRIVGECSSGGTAIGPWMLERGQAVVYRSFLKTADRTAYLDAEERAKAAGAGIWSEEFVPPAEWRHHRTRLMCER